ncbi:WecB/TagA/CpsF family glycosyltransferase [Clostridium perfringens]|uniref:N-acetylglucosaminyldiphosphoundecaprenol N-acetyl-beta-D-mannosaminyltransferase n=1 Tax=Clostridium perfringens E str. JGS1987 TaxID=451755 RepID=B1BT39_CLOPF|nr:WecB/TagA/CpsF family glycosyltransferase [Clostridium perfringens]ALG49478.1 N-acetylmannosaminyltransferase [Clostridium perfringens]EDT15092.1 glycosyl transferase, WecB/TagA/CpsF family [Clostridium perfringens E str. JGS1987]EHK2387592.1 WecB/TagA/CpsF family glycosyltransferase [Clostridium perfringens]EHK2402580.1 WecB/TagA/CpsF family glycosyltransferase [Clostridium perfringens]EJT5933489.1 WecB/TagA/CpsF family glycosyltransferase [Clostridium perfringens]
MYKELLGYKIFSDNKEELLKEIENKKRVNIISGNPEVLYNGIKNEFLRNSFTKEDALIIPDGVGTLLAAKINGIDITEKIAGIEVMNMLLEEARDKNLKVFLLGAKEEILIKCKEKIKENYDGINIVGSNNGFFDLDNCDDLIEKINESKADILFVAMGAPRQEVFIEKYKDKLCCKIFMGVGGSFDVFAGNVNRAPQFMINIGMEWLYRVAKEPWRIKRLGSIPKFLVLSIKERGKR